MLRHSNGKPPHSLLLKIAAGNTLVTLNVWLPSILKAVLTKALQSLELWLGGVGKGITLIFTKLWISLLTPKSKYLVKRGTDMVSIAAWIFFSWYLFNLLVCSQKNQKVTRDATRQQERRRHLKQGSLMLFDLLVSNRFWLMLSTRGIFQ